MCVMEFRTCGKYSFNATFSWWNRISSLLFLRRGLYLFPPVCTLMKIIHKFRPQLMAMINWEPLSWIYSDYSVHIRRRYTQHPPTALCTYEPCRGGEFYIFWTFRWKRTHVEFWNGWPLPNPGNARFLAFSQWFLIMLLLYWISIFFLKRYEQENRSIIHHYCLHPEFIISNELMSRDCWI